MSRHTGGVSPAVSVKSLTPSKPVQAGARVAARPPPEVGLLPPLPRLVAPDPAGDRHHAVEQEARVGAHNCDPERVAGHLREDGVGFWEKDELFDFDFDLPGFILDEPFPKKLSAPASSTVREVLSKYSYLELLR